MRKNAKLLLRRSIFTLLSVFVVTNVADAQSLENGKPYELDEVVVVGEPVYGSMFGNTGYVGSLMGAQNVMDIPLETTSLKEDALTTFASPDNELYDALTVSPAVRQSTSSIGIRGFYTTTDAMSVNGVSGMVADSGMATNYLEQVNIVSGPSLVFAGSNSNSSRPNSGGSIMLQTKKAKMDSQFDLTLKYASRSQLTEAIDFGHRFGDRSEWGIRVNTEHRGGGTVIHGEKKPLTNFYVNIDHKDELSTSNLLIGYETKKTFGGSDYWRPQQGGDASTGFIPEVPNGSYNQLPDWIRKHTKNFIAVFNHEQNLSDDVQVFVNAGYRKTDTPVRVSGSMNNPLIFEPDGSFAGQFQLTNVKASASKEEKRYIGAGVRIQSDFHSLHNELVIGIDRSEYKSWSGKATKLNPADFIGNIYQDNMWEEPDYTIDPKLTFSGQRRVTSLSAIDTMKLMDDRLIFVVGAHHHQYTAYGVKAGTITNSETFSATVPTFGVVYKVTPTFMVYANHARDFQRGKVVDDKYANGGEILDPDITKSSEIGFKYSNGSFLHTFSVFKANDPEYLVTPDNRYTKDGRTVYKGGVYSVAGSIGKWDIFGGIGYARRIWDVTANQSILGTDADGIPRWNGSLGMIYHANENLDFMGRVLYTGPAKIYTGRLTVSSSTRLDLGACYKTHLNEMPVTITGMVYNVLNHRYWITANQGNQLRASAPRTVALQATFSF